jgi:uncharacterized membrane-anchored protein
MTQKQLAIIAGLWTLIIASVIAFKQFTLLTGTVVILNTTPIDPRDLFRGDYVTLNYDISRPQNIPGGAQFQSKNQPVYILLTTDNTGIAKATGITTTIPSSEILYIKGQLQYNQINYGIESYFVPEHAGKELERQRGKSLQVEVAIDRSGQAVIKSLLINGSKVQF